MSSRYGEDYAFSLDEEEHVGTLPPKHDKTHSDAAAAEENQDERESSRIVAAVEDTASDVAIEGLRAERE